jgi:hypothetical protein
MMSSEFRRDLCIRIDKDEQLRSVRSVTRDETQRRPIFPALVRKAACRTRGTVDWGTALLDPYGLADVDRARRLVALTGRRPEEVRFSKRVGVVVALECLHSTELDIARFLQSLKAGMTHDVIANSPFELEVTVGLLPVDDGGGADAGSREDPGEGMSLTSVLLVAALHSQRAEPDDDLLTHVHGTVVDCLTARTPSEVVACSVVSLHVPIRVLLRLLLQCKGGFLSSP